MEIDDIIIICNAYSEGYEQGFLTQEFEQDDNPYPENSVNYIAWSYGFHNSKEETKVVH